MRRRASLNSPLHLAFAAEFAYGVCWWPFSCRPAALLAMKYGFTVCAQNALNQFNFRVYSSWLLQLMSTRRSLLVAHINWWTWCGLAMMAWCVFFPGNKSSLIGFRYILNNSCQLEEFKPYFDWQAEIHHCYYYSVSPFLSPFNVQLILICSSIRPPSVRPDQTHVQ